MMKIEKAYASNQVQDLNTVDGLDPVLWPGSNYEMINHLPGFVEPEQVVKILNTAVEGDVKWSMERPARAGVERLCVFKCADLPLEVRVRLSGMGLDPSTDSINYVLEFKFLLGTQTKGFYSELEVKRGSLADVAIAASEIQALTAGHFSNYCKFEPERPIIGKLEELENIIKQTKLALEERQ